jgi:2,6-dihydroxypseudooxynicotine hydrolase
MEVNHAARNWEHWADLLARRACHYQQLGDRADTVQHSLSAAELWTTAAAYYHFAQLRLLRSSHRKGEYQALVWDNFRKASRRMQPPAQRLDIPFAGVQLPGYLRLKDRDAPLVLLIGGLDSEKEVELASFAQYFLARGNSVFFFDGPGQGELSGRLTMEAGFNHAVSTILDFFESRCVCNEAFGLFGVSFGGYLACQAAACDPRIRACVSLGGFFDGGVLQRLPDTAVETVRIAFGLCPEDDLLSLHSEISLGSLAGMMDRPLLVMHGSDDHLVDSFQIDQLESWATGPKVVRRIPGGEHVCTNRFSECLPEIADWMTEQLLHADGNIGGSVCPI